MAVLDLSTLDIFYLNFIHSYALYNSNACSESFSCCLLFLIVKFTIYPYFSRFVVNNKKIMI